MQFKRVLPILQTVAMVLILWSPWSPQAHDIVLMNGRKIWTIIPGLNGFEWAEGMNLPASAIVTPIEFVTRNGRTWPSLKVMFFGLWIGGLLCWYMLGRFLDDVIQWRRSGVLPPKHRGDLSFALIAVPSAILLAAAFWSAEAGAPIIAAWGGIWVLVSGAALVFRLLQFIRQRRTAAV